MLKVKLSIPGAGDNVDLSQYVGNDSNVIDGCIFLPNQDTSEADIWFVIEDGDIHNICNIVPENVIYLTAETSWEPGFFDSPGKREYLQQFGKIFTCHDIYLPKVEFSIPFLPWMIYANHGPTIYSKNLNDINKIRNQTSINKTKKLSVICSSQQLTPLHKLRFRFVEELKNHFGDRLDWYGNGVNSIDKKWEGLSEYEYSIILENNSRNNVITEKIQDSFLALTFPIYWGASNIGEYFPSDSFQSIDIFDINGSINVIEKLISEDAYSLRLPKILEAKKVVLEEIHFLKRMAAIAKDVYEENQGKDKKIVVLSPSNYFENHSQKLVSRAVKKVVKIFGNG